MCFPSTVRIALYVQSERAGGDPMGSPLPLRNETWVPRCKCGNGNLVLAPGNQCTHGVLSQVEVYCPECHWQAKLADVIKQLYVRL